MGQRRQLLGIVRLPSRGGRLTGGRLARRVAGRSRREASGDDRRDVESVIVDHIFVEGVTLDAQLDLAIPQLHRAVAQVDLAIPELDLAIPELGDFQVRRVAIVIDIVFEHDIVFEFVIVDGRVRRQRRGRR